MKVILLDEVKGKGIEGDVVDVARGFAVNFLLPRKLAVEATTGNLKQLEARKGNISKREEARRSDAETKAAAIAGKTVIVEAKAGDEGRLYGSVTTGMIAEAIADQLGVEVDRRRTDVHGHIKTVGEHPVTVAVHQDVKADLIVQVVPVGGTAEAAAVAAAEKAHAAEPQAEEQAESGEEPAEETAEGESSEDDEAAE
jgi:large subunit ribosomal protein L9